MTRNFISNFIFIAGTIFSTSSWPANTLNGFDISNALVPEAQLVHGGPPRDGIPSIDNPRYVNARHADFMEPDDIILGLEIKGIAAAYPRHILNWHEIVNTEIGNKDVLVSYCPLCGSGVAFSSQVGDKQLEFGVSGILYNSDLVFYDRQTESLWSQLEGKSISGPMKGRQLDTVPLQHTTWQNWIEHYPESRVLSEQQGFKRNYRHSPYGGYESSGILFFKTLRKTPDILHIKAPVFGVKINGKAKAYPYEELRKLGKQRFEDSVGSETVTIIWDPKHNTARALGSSGQTLAGTRAFWFAWYNFNPDTDVFQVKALQ